MSRVEVAYTGNQQYEALNTRNAKRVAVDCSMTRGEEFGPESLVAAGLGSCMLISMATFAERHGLDVTGSRADIDVFFGGRPETRITSIDVTVHVPKTFAKDERAQLEIAASACPIKHSFRSDTKISTQFEYGAEPAQAA